MRQRYLWLLIAACLVPLMLTGNTAWTEQRVAAGTIDSAGINQLIKASKGAVIVAIAAWCLPCREELPILVKLYKKNKSHGLQIIGISLDPGGPSAIQPLLDKADVNFPVYWAGEEAVKDFNISAIPFFLFIKDGTIVEKFAGKRHEKFLDKKIKDLLK
jgi:thiol-disulfide isomerase/thioredoxin